MYAAQWFMVSMGLNTVDDFVLDMTMMRIGNPSPVEQAEFQTISMGRCKQTF